MGLASRIAPGYYRVPWLLLQKLPQSGRWTHSRRTQWLKAMTATVDYLVETENAECLCADIDEVRLQFGGCTLHDPELIAAPPQREERE